MYWRRCSHKSLQNRDAEDPDPPKLPVVAALRFGAIREDFTVSRALHTCILGIGTGGCPLKMAKLSANPVALDIKLADDDYIMLQVYLDQNALETTNLGPSLGHVVEEARARAASKGRVLVEIFWNESPISAEELAMPVPDSTSIDLDDGFDDVDDDEGQGASPPSQSTDDDILQCVSADPHELVLDIIEQSMEALDELQELHTETADLIQAGQTVHALPKLMQITNIWQQVQLGVDRGAQLLNIELSDIRLNDKAFNEAISHLIAQLQAFKEALNAKDWVLVSDALAYEMNPIVDMWRGLLDTFRTHVETSRPAEKS